MGLSVDVANREGGGKCLIVCGVLRDEVEAIVRRQVGQVAVSYLAPAPCIDQERFPRLLEAALQRRRGHCTEILVAIGRCHPDVDAILAAYGARRLPVDNCFEALLGDRVRDYVREANTFFTTPAWLKHWRRALATGMRWDEVDTRQNFGLYGRILLLDAGVTPYTDEEVLEFFDYVQVPVETLSIDLSHLASLLFSK